MNRLIRSLFILKLLCITILQCLVEAILIRTKHLFMALLDVSDLMLHLANVVP